MLTPEERLEQLETVFEELEEASKTTPIIVEGKKDAKALERLGIVRNIVTLSTGLSIVAFSETLSLRWRRAVILTDWDRKGGQLARMLKEALATNGVEVNDGLRAQLAMLSKKEAKDIEGLPKFVQRLRSEAGLEARRKTQVRFWERR